MTEQAAQSIIPFPAPDQSRPRDASGMRQRAMRNGYRGPWPPVKRPPCRNEEEYRDLLRRAYGGDRRAGVMAQLAVHTTEFFAVLPPERFAAMAEVLIATVHDRRNKDGARLHAISAAIRPAIEVMRLLQRWQKRTPHRAVDQMDRLLESIGAYLSVLGRRRPQDAAGRTEIACMAEALFELSMGAGTNRLRVNAIESALKHVLTMMQFYWDASAVLEHREAKHDGGNEAIALAETELMAMRDELDLARAARCS